MASKRKAASTKGAESDEEANGVDNSDADLDSLPEGTVVVHPEPVKKKGSFRGPEFRSKKKRKERLKYRFQFWKFR